MKARISASSWVAVWLAEQNLAGLDIVTDGEQRRRHYNWGFLEALGEVDFENLGLRSSRGQRYTEETLCHRAANSAAWDAPTNFIRRSRRDEDPGIAGRASIRFSGVKLLTSPTAALRSTRSTFHIFRPSLT